MRFEVDLPHDESLIGNPTDFSGSESQSCNNANSDRQRRCPVKIIQHETDGRRHTADERNDNLMNNVHACFAELRKCRNKILPHVDKNEPLALRNADLMASARATWAMRSVLADTH